MMTMMISTPTDLTRRGLLLGTVASLAMAAAPALALNTDQATSLIDNVVADVNRVINSGKSEPAMIVDFEQIFAKFADVRFIAYKTLGPPARSASQAQMKAFTAAFRGYISRKYGKRFREFIGGEINVQKARKVKSHYEVKTRTVLRGVAPFDVTYLVSDKSGKPLFFDMRIEGVSLVNAEKEEIGALLDRNGGNINKLTAVLKKSG